MEIRDTKSPSIWTRKSNRSKFGSTYQKRNTLSPLKVTLKTPVFVIKVFLTNCKTEDVHKENELESTVERLRNEIMSNELKKKQRMQTGKNAATKRELITRFRDVRSKNLSMDYSGMVIKQANFPVNKLKDSLNQTTRIGIKTSRVISCKEETKNNKIRSSLIMTEENLESRQTNKNAGNYGYANLTKFNLNFGVTLRVSAETIEGPKCSDDPKIKSRIGTGFPKVKVEAKPSKIEGEIEKLEKNNSEKTIGVDLLIKNNKTNFAKHKIYTGTLPLKGSARTRYVLPSIRKLQEKVIVKKEILENELKHIEESKSLVTIARNEVMLQQLPAKKRSEITSSHRRYRLAAKTGRIIHHRLSISKG